MACSGVGTVMVNSLNFCIIQANNPTGESFQAYEKVCGAARSSA